MSAKKLERSTLNRIADSMRGTTLDRARACLPWIGLCAALGLLLSGLWLRDLDQKSQAPIRRTEVQLDKIKILEDAGWQQWLGDEIVATRDVQKVADAWVALTQDHPGLPSVAPARLAQVDGGRLTVTYVLDASEDQVTAHATAAAEQMGVVQVWSDQQGFDAWYNDALSRRITSIIIAVLALALGLFSGVRLWKSQWEQSRSFRTSLVQLGFSRRGIERSFARILGLRALLCVSACSLFFVSVHGLRSLGQTTPVAEPAQVSSVFRPRSMEIPLASNFPCGEACKGDPESKTEHEYLVDHKLAVLARQDRALDRHEDALRPWLWSLSRTPSTTALRTVLSANLVNPELETRFSAWDIEDQAFRRSLQEVDALAQRLDTKKNKVLTAAQAVAKRKNPVNACDGGLAPWAAGSLTPWANGRSQKRTTRERLQGLQDPALEIVAKRGTKVRSSVDAEVAAILRDTPGRFTLILDSGQSWIWALGGMAALEVHSGDRVRAGDTLGEVARPGPHDEGVSALRVELWKGTRQADPSECFAQKAQSRSGSKRRNASLGSEGTTRYNAR